MLELEVALLLYAQNTNRTTTRTRFLLADSSPSRLINWLWNETHGFDLDTLWDFWMDVQDMTLKFQKLAIAADVANVALPQRIPLNIALLRQARRIHDSCHHHVHLPTSLARKHVAVVHKTAALMHYWSLENPEPALLQSFVRSIFSLTSDMGTEIHIPEVQVPLEELQPLHLQPPCLEGSLQDDLIDADGCRASLFRQSQAGTQLLEHVIMIPGLQHITDGVLASVHKNLLHWSTFLSQLRNIEGLLRDRRAHFVKTCVLGSEYEHRQDEILRFGKTLYEGRWHEIINFLIALLPILPLVAACWSEDRFGPPSHNVKQPVELDEQPAASRSGPRNFDRKLCTATLRSPLFHTYAWMLATLDGIPEAFVSWASGCRCHDGWCTGRHREQRTAIYRAHYGHGATTCPMAGRRAPELASGSVSQLLRALASSSILPASHEKAYFLTPEENAILHKDLSAGLDHICWALESKLRFWRQCPWMLCSLGHHDPSKVQENARQIQACAFR